uniref:RRP15-like protein n=1 Tax=Sexangularia sp. CB-2014 TaxID=1486929 RepID=A0A7S1YJD2_9EUKA|mmetsp:Transcript_6033/g.19701  ORF Transcript_6033/g.19701 Transcript_6033/m.19701 type:complete len:431 (+) Transcript_6033:108-1400(+)
MGKQIQLAPAPRLPKKKASIIAALKSIEGRGDQGTTTPNNNPTSSNTLSSSSISSSKSRKKDRASSGASEGVAGRSKPRSFAGSKTNASRFAVLAETLDALEAEEALNHPQETDKDLARLEAKALRKAAQKAARETAGHRVEKGGVVQEEQQQEQQQEQEEEEEMVEVASDVEQDDEDDDSDGDVAGSPAGGDRPSKRRRDAASRIRVAPEAREEVERLLAEAGEAGADSDDDGGDSDVSESDDDGLFDTGADESRVGKPAAFASALAEALSRPVPENQPAVLSRSSAVGQAAAEERERERERLEGEVRSRADRRYARDQLKRLRTTLPCAVARPTSGPSERALRGVATKGVVQLFNILDKQAKAEKELKRERAKRQNRVLLGGSGNSAKGGAASKRVKRDDEDKDDAVIGGGGSLTQASFLELLARKAH